MVWVNRYEQRKVEEARDQLSEDLTNEEVIMLAQLWIIEELDHLMTRKRGVNERRYRQALIGILEERTNTTTY